MLIMEYCDRYDSLSGIKFGNTSRARCPELSKAMIYMKPRPWMTYVGFELVDDNVSIVMTASELQYSRACKNPLIRFQRSAFPLKS